MHQINLDFQVICDFELDPLGCLLRSQASLQQQAASPLAGHGTGEPSQGQRLARRYQYDLAGQLLGIDDRLSGATRYGYDVLGRLLSAQPKSRPTPSTWGANKPNRLRVWQEHRYAYDTWGNCIEKKSGPHSERHLHWDAEHQLSRVTVTRQQGRFSQTEHWGYDYDPFGRRIAKYRLDPNNEKRNRPWLDDTTTHYSWDGNRLLLERQGDKQQLYVYEPHSFVPLALVRSDATKEIAGEKPEGLPAEYLALKEQHPEQWETTLNKLPRKVAAAIRQQEQPASPDKSPAEILYYHADHLGTPRELTDSDGNILWAATYKAWGNTATIEHPPRLATATDGNTLAQRWEQQAEPIEQNLRFQGQYFDLETGLHYNRFRYYDPDCGRFVSQDPIGLAGGHNLYKYARNPTGYIDPFGLSDKCLYRGVHAKHPAVNDAKNGRVSPSNPNARLTPEQHAAGGLTGDSQYVSWTPDKGLALEHARKEGAGGVLLEVPVGAPQPGDSWKWGWTHINDWGEVEMLQEGEGSGIKSTILDCCC